VPEARQAREPLARDVSPGQQQTRVRPPGLADRGRRFEGPVRQWRRLCSRFQTTTPTRMGLALPGTARRRTPRRSTHTQLPGPRACVEGPVQGEGHAGRQPLPNSKQSAYKPACPARPLTPLFAVCGIRMEARDFRRVLESLAGEVIRSRRAT